MGVSSVPRITYLARHSCAPALSGFPGHIVPLTKFGSSHEKLDVLPRFNIMYITMSYFYAIVIFIISQNFSLLL